jgi:hypothetical protein
MAVRSDSAAAEIADIANVATVDASLIPALVKLLNQYPHSTRVAIAALASALGGVSQS